MRIAALVSTCLVFACCATRQPSAPAAGDVTRASETVGGVVATSDGARPTTEEACHKSCNGDWGAHGHLQKVTCICRTHDSGKECRAGKDCEGVCLLRDPVQVVTVEAGPPARGFFVGACSEFVTVFGCFRRLTKGDGHDEASPIDPPPAVMCMD